MFGRFEEKSHGPTAPSASGQNVSGLKTAGQLLKQRRTSDIFSGGGKMIIAIRRDATPALHHLRRRWHDVGEQWGRSSGVQVSSCQ